MTVYLIEGSELDALLNAIKRREAHGFGKIYALRIQPGAQGITVRVNDAEWTPRIGRVEFDVSGTVALNGSVLPASSTAPGPTIRPCSELPAGHFHCRHGHVDDCPAPETCFVIRPSAVESMNAALRTIARYQGPNRMIQGKATVHAVTSGDRLLCNPTRDTSRDTYPVPAEVTCGNCLRIKANMAG